MLVNICRDYGLTLQVDEILPAVRPYPQAQEVIGIDVPEASADDGERPVEIPPTGVSRSLHLRPIARQLRRYDAVEAHVSGFAGCLQNVVQRHRRIATNVGIAHALTGFHFLGISQIKKDVRGLRDS